MKRMSRLMSHTLCTVLLGLAIAGGDEAFAQSTGTPTFFAPVRAFGSTESGLSVSRPAAGAIGFEGRYGVALDRADLSFRAGYVDSGGAADGRFVAGAEVRVPVISRSPTFPLDGALVVGVGHIFESGAGQTIVPVGLSIGRRFIVDGDAFQLTPYVQPTIIFESETLATMGLGVDLRLQGIPDVRVNWAIGDMDGFSVSLYWVR